MSAKSPTHASAALPPDVKPSLENNELLIKKFLKSCKKENIQDIFDISAGVRRFQTKSQRERDERRRAREKAIREYKQSENMNADDKKRK
jgi:hypothetical protein